MCVLKSKVFFLLFLLYSTMVAADPDGKIYGRVTDVNGQPVIGGSVYIKSVYKGASADLEGYFEINEIEPNTYLVSASSMGFHSQEKTVTLKPGDQVLLNFSLEEEANELGEVKVSAASKSSLIEQKGYSVNAIETQDLRSQSIEINNVLKQSAGVGVRETGGMGSKANYYLSGMNGNSIQTLIDYIPTDFYGSSYSISMLPISMVDRIDIYKGVVPVMIGTDALGGAINAVTTTESTNFFDASYSGGSFNSHRASLQGQWTAPKSGFTTRLSTFYNYSDNSYKVWGTSVYVANESTGWRPVNYTKENPATRFNDDIKNVGGKFDLGFTDVKWADKFFLTLAASDLKKGVQTGQTMAKVFGAVRYNSDYKMSSMMYQKDDLILEGLGTDVFVGYSETEGTFIDTSSVQYNWTGDSIGMVAGGEMSSSYKSMYTETRKNWIERLNLSYEINEKLKLNLCYVNRRTEQLGNDIYQADYRQTYTEPQHMYTNFLGFSVYNVNLNNRLRSNAFVKYYGAKSTLSDVETIENNDPVTIFIDNVIDKWGVGYASSFDLNHSTIVQLSFEKAIRLPSVDESLGNGATILSNPYLEPEESFNINLDLMLGRYELAYNHGLNLGLNVFYRDVKNLLQLAEVESMGTAQYENISEVLKTGASLEMKYDYDHKLTISANATYLDMRNNQKYDYDTGKDNIIYKDRLKNEPYLMLNSAARYTFHDAFIEDAKINIYFSGGYTHEFYLLWPSLGDPDTKDVVPSQLKFDAGVSYRFPDNHLTLAFDCSNIFNEQVYDNYLLQKPGRSLLFKIAYHISN